MPRTSSHFARFIALRYLRGVEGAQSGGRFLRLVLYVAVGGVAVGVAALMLALAIVRGFAGEVEQKIVTFGSHIQVSSLRDAPLDTTVVGEAQLRAFQGVETVSPVVSGFVLLRGSDKADIDGVVCWGTDVPPSLMREAIQEGAFATQSDDGSPGIVIGKRLARKMDVQIGDKLTAFSPPATGGGIGRTAQARSFVVTGLYETFLSDFDELYVFTSETDARKLLSVPFGQITRFDLTLTDVQQAYERSRALEAEFGFPVLAQTVFELYANLFAWIDLQQSIVPLVIGILVVVAAFNLIGILFMLVLEKTSEVAVLTSLGATPAQVRRVFLLLGLLVGVGGALIGVGIAVVVGVLQQQFGFIPLPPEAYFLDHAPVDFAWLDFVIVPVIAIVLSTASAYLPARWAAKADPVRALRFA